VVVMAASAWWLVGFGGWLGIVLFTLALMAAAKRGDRQLEHTSGAGDEWLAGIDLAAIAACVGDSASGVVVAVREPRPLGQVIAVRAEGEAARLAGRVLAPDDFVTARAAFTGKCEYRARVAAIPLRRGRRTIGAIGVTIADERAPLRPRELDALTRAVAAVATEPPVARRRPR
jgi:hypothetical protein